MVSLFLTAKKQIDISIADSNSQLTNAAIQGRSTPCAPIAFGVELPLFLRVVIGLLSGLVALSVLAIIYSRLHSTPNMKTRIGLDYCGTLPCFMGITPGWTNWSKARAALPLMGTPQMFEHQNFFWIGADRGVALYPSADGLSVGLIYIAVRPEMALPVGEIVNQYGPPCIITIPLDSADQTLTLYYPGLTVIAQMSHSRLTVDTPVRYIALSEPTDLPNMRIAPCYKVALEHDLPPNIARPWRGFASVGDYLSEDYPSFVILEVQRLVDAILRINAYALCIVCCCQCPFKVTKEGYDVKQSQQSNAPSQLINDRDTAKRKGREGNGLRFTGRRAC